MNLQVKQMVLKTGVKIFSQLFNIQFCFFNRFV